MLCGASSKNDLVQGWGQRVKRREVQSCFGRVELYFQKSFFHSDVRQRFMYQNRHSKSYQLPFNQGVQVVIPPRSPAIVPEPSDSILHRSEWPGFVVHYINTIVTSAEHSQLTWWPMLEGNVSDLLKKIPLFLINKS